jgi:type II secretory pathway pseudopilin PulG
VRSRVRKKQRRALGFSLFEVLIAILVGTLFFLVVIQASTLSSYSRAQALESSEVLSWVQKDLESIRFEAGRYLITRLSRPAQPNDSSLSVESSGDFSDAASLRLVEAQSLRTQTFIIQASDPRLSSTQGQTSDPLLDSSSSQGLSPGTPSEQDGYPAQTQDTSVYKIGQAIGDRIDLETPTKISVPHPEGTFVVGIFKNCQAEASPDGLANRLRTKLTGQLNVNDDVSGLLPLERTRTSTNKQFRVRRDLNLIQNSPYHRLQVRYTIYPPEGTALPFQEAPGNSRAFVMEVIPDAAFYCP